MTIMPRQDIERLALDYHEIRGLESTTDNENLHEGLLAIVTAGDTEGLQPVGDG
ncbi:MAG: hypothetical protein ABSG53_12895 [Thermoguttaceae bacterium]|jgi:hypothetical protein